MAVIIVIAVTSLGYYQFVYCTSSSCTTSNSTSATASANCTPPACVTILINSGASTLTTTAFSPDNAKLVIGVNNTFQFFNNDSQSGGVAHTATVKSCPQNCAFDTGVFAYNATSAMYTITTAGTYAYFCQIHPGTMVGTVVVVAGKGGSGASSSTSSNSVGTTSSSSSAIPTTRFAVSIPNGASADQSTPGFVPDTVTVVVGVNNTIVWTNNDVGAHTVTSTTIPSGAKSFNSALMAPNAVYWQTLTVPGTYHYICSLHGWMKATIIVKSG